MMSKFKFPRIEPSSLQSQIEKCDEQKSVLSGLQTEAEKLSIKGSLLDGFKARLDSFAQSKQEKASNIVQVNVGGKVIAIRRQTLQLHSTDNLLAAILCGRYDYILPRAEQGKIFLDLEPKWVDPVFNFMREMGTWSGEESSRPQMASVSPLFADGFAFVLNYFTPSAARGMQSQSNLQSSSVILKDLKMDTDKALLEMLIDSPDNKSLSATLLYRGSVDGFDAFHAKCDGHANTLTVVKDTTGDVFGGFLGIAWPDASLNNYVVTDNAFLFSLKRNGVPAAHKLSNKRSVYTAYSGVSYGPVFGHGHDLCIYNSANSNNYSYSLLGNSFSQQSGPVAFPHLSANQHFQVSEIEVFDVTVSTTATAAKGCPHIAAHCIADTAPRMPKFEVSSIACAALSARSGVLQSLHDAVALTNTVQQYTFALLYAEHQLLCEAVAFRDELRFVAAHVGMHHISTADAITGAGDEHCVCPEAEFAAVLGETEQLVGAFTSEEVYSAAHSDASDVVTVNAGGALFAVSKATLRQAPAGSVLFNLASDAWAQDSDGEGHAFQDVDSELFALVVAHLRLRALLAFEHTLEAPAIAVREEQRKSLENLLGFYMLSDAVTIKSVKGVL